MCNYYFLKEDSSFKNQIKSFRIPSCSICMGLGIFAILKFNAPWLLILLENIFSKKFEQILIKLQPIVSNVYVRSKTIQKIKERLTGQRIMKEFDKCILNLTKRKGVSKRIDKVMCLQNLGFGPYYNEGTQLSEMGPNPLVCKIGPSPFNQIWTHFVLNCYDIEIVKTKEGIGECECEWTNWQWHTPFHDLERQWLDFPTCIVRYAAGTRLPNLINNSHIFGFL